MTTHAPRSPYPGILPVPPASPAVYKEIYEDTLACAKRIAVAYAEAYRTSGAAYTEAARKVALRVDSRRGASATEAGAD